MESTIAEHVRIDPNVCGGKPRIAGTRIRVADIARWHEREGRTPAEIVAEFGLSLADVHAALAYYFDHREVVDERSAASRAFADELRAATPSKLVGKLTLPPNGE